MLVLKSTDDRILKAFKPLRLTYFVDKKGEFHCEEIVAFDSRIFNPERIESEVGYKEAGSLDVTAPRGLWHLEDLDDRQLRALVEAYEADRRSPKAGDYKEQSRRRAVKRMRGYALANEELDLFVTLTLSPDKVDRTDYGEAVKRVGVWLDNRARRHGLKYLLVPELHEAGGIHFHGFFNRSAVRLVNSGLKRDPRKNLKRGEFKNFRAAVEPHRKGKVIYNLPDFDIGYTTALRVGHTWEDRQKAIAYCLKYMSKGAEKVGGRWYLHGGDLAGPQYAYFDYGEPGRWCETFADLPGDAFEISDGLRCKVLRGGDLAGFEQIFEKLC